MVVDIETTREKFPEMSMVLGPSFPSRALRRNGLGELVAQQAWEMEKGYFPNSRFDALSIEPKTYFGGGVSLSYVQSQIIKMLRIPAQRRDGLGNLVESGVAAQANFKLKKNRNGGKPFMIDIGTLKSSDAIDKAMQCLQRTVRIGNRAMRRNGLGELVPKTLEFENWNL
jgi:hypothetical protein